MRSSSFVPRHALVINHPTPPGRYRNMGRVKMAGSKDELEDARAGLIG